MNKMSANQRNLAITLLLCCSAVAYVFALFLPTQRSIAKLQVELAEHQSTVSQSQSLNVTLATLDEELASTRAFAQSWRETAPAANGRAAALGVVTRCASEAGVRMLQFDPQPTEPLETVAKIPISLTCQGEFPDVVHLLRKLESLPATIWMEEVRIHVPKMRSNENNSGRSVVECELRLVVFADNHNNSS